MFTPDQVMHYQTFGYLIMRNVFTPAEIKTMQREFDTAMARTDDFTPTDGESTHTHAIMLGDDTPFFASLNEDQRICGPAQQTMGDDAVLWEWQGYRYCMFKGTFWHANDGDPTFGRYKYGARFQWPLFEPVAADTGALRIIPGSHLPEFQWQLRKADAASLLDPIEDVGAVVCAAELGDVVAFDTRVYHASAPYHRERRVFSAIYAHFPETQEETAVTAPGFPRGQEQWQQWRANKPDSPFRHRWETLVARMQEMQKTCGYRVAHYEDGRTAEVVPA